MSNQERLPLEEECDGRTPGRTVEILAPRQVPLGGLRAMTVRRTLPQRERSLIGAWCFLDHYGPDDVKHTGGMRVDAHPHVGLQTVSWLFSGEIEHRDSVGFHAMVRPGELNLMTAGRGISHSERSTAETTILHGVQLWVALPSDQRQTAPDFEHYAPPMVLGRGWRGQVFLGSLLGHTSPVRTFSPLVGAEFCFEPGAILDLEVERSFEHGILVDDGSISIARSSGWEGIETNELGYIPPSAAYLRLRAGRRGARILFLGGELLGEQIVMWWNFIGETHEEIVQARRDWQATLARVGVADPAGVEMVQADSDRFKLPRFEPAPPLPAPPLPNATLLPRA